MADDRESGFSWGKMIGTGALATVGLLAAAIVSDDIVSWLAPTGTSAATGFSGALAKGVEAAGSGITSVLGGIGGYFDSSISAASFTTLGDTMGSIGKMATSAGTSIANVATTYPATTAAVGGLVVGGLVGRATASGGQGDPVTAAAQRNWQQAMAERKAIAARLAQQRT